MKDGLILNAKLITSADFLVDALIFIIDLIIVRVCMFRSSSFRQLAGSERSHA